MTASPQHPCAPAPTMEADVIVIGGGSGGLAAAFRAAEYGRRVVLLEPAALGGTCVNVGCVPKKAMWLAANFAQQLQHARHLGFDLAPGALDWPRFISRREDYIANIHASYRRRLATSGITTLATRGRLQDAQTVLTDDGQRLRAPHIVIATGAQPRRPALPGAELGLVSDDFFALRAAPARVALIGGGYIAVELAGMLRALGSDVTLYVRGPRLLEGFDPDLTDALAAACTAQGIDLRLRTAPQRLSPAAGNPAALDAQVLPLPARRLRVDTTLGEHGDTFDAVFFATGRAPNTAGLGLEAIGVTLDLGGHVDVDAWQDTRVPGVHAVGDVTNAPALTPVAIAAARRLMDRLFGGQPDARLRADSVPTVVFSHPPLATVGLTEPAARRLHGDAVRTHRAEFRPMFNALADAPQRSVFKLVSVGDDDRVVGIHLLGDGADEILQGFAVALQRGITLRDLHDTVAIHPTSAEEVVLIR